MSLKAGIVGLPNVGKSTLFNAITKKNIIAANYPFATIEPNVGIVMVPDKRMDFLVNMYEPKSVVPTSYEFIDIAGLVKGASSGEGLGNKFLSHIREVDAIVHVVRCFDNPEIIHVSGKVDPISDIERSVLHELIQSNYHEYLMKSDFVSCCYTAMNAFLTTAYCIVSEGLNQYISNIDITVDIYDTVIEITLTLVETKPDVIFVDWHSINKINDLYMLYLTQYPGLEKSSILDLVSADVIEKEYYTKDERFTIAPSILMKQYLSIIEREVNNIIQLSKLPNTENKHYNWYDMKNFVKKRGIELEYVPFRLYKALDALYKFRNESMHGETDITNEDYEILLSYKNQNLFMGLSVKLLALKGIVIHPTVDEIGKYTGLAPQSTLSNKDIKK